MSSNTVQDNAKNLALMGSILNSIFEWFILYLDITAMYTNYCTSHPLQQDLDLVDSYLSQDLDGWQPFFSQIGDPERVFNIRKERYDAKVKTFLHHNKAKLNKLNVDDE